MCVQKFELCFLLGPRVLPKESGTTIESGLCWICCVLPCTDYSHAQGEMLKCRCHYYFCNGYVCDVLNRLLPFIKVSGKKIYVATQWTNLTVASLWKKNSLPAVPASPAVSSTQPCIQIMIALFKWFCSLFQCPVAIKPGFKPFFITEKINHNSTTSLKSFQVF